MGLETKVRPKTDELNKAKSGCGEPALCFIEFTSHVSSGVLTGMADEQYTSADVVLPKRLMDLTISVTQKKQDENQEHDKGPSVHEASTTKSIRHGLPPFHLRKVRFSAT